MCVTYGGTPCPACDDVDEDGVCDDEDDCVGSYDDCGVCNGPGAVRLWLYRHSIW